MHFNPSKAQEERRAKRFWTVLVLLLLGIQLSIGFVAIRLSVGDPSLAIVPNYHQAALNWDEHRSAHTAIHRLGLDSRLEVSKHADTSGRRAVMFQLLDRHGQSIPGLKVTATIYHHARAAQSQTIGMEDVGKGIFMVSTFMPRDGLWQINLEIHGAPEPLRVSRTLTL